MTTKSFCQLVNEELLPSHNFPHNLPRSISVCTATWWLHQLEYHLLSQKKGAHVDGREREGVVTCRNEFPKELEDLRETHLPPPVCSDERAAIPPPDAESRKTLVLVYHDESIINTNEGQVWMWATEDVPILWPKTEGSGIMVSDFIEQHSIFLRLTDSEFDVYIGNRSQIWLNSWSQWPRLYLDVWPCTYATCT